MDKVITAMLERYHCKTRDDYENALKEIIQQVTLLGLWRAKFFEHAAFYRGTALRIVYELDRFSEDLDFSLLKSNAHFSLELYLRAIQKELDALGFHVEVSEKKKTKKTAIQSAFVKVNIKHILSKIDVPKAVKSYYHKQALLKVKIEVDTEPPLGFNTEAKSLLDPIPFSVNIYKLPDLFAGKICAMLCRQWGNRVKGRDWYDFLWFIQRKVPVHLQHLEERLRVFGYYNGNEPLKKEKLDEWLTQRIECLDIEQAKTDIVTFIKDPQRVEGWSQSIFLLAAKQLQTLSL